MSSNKRQHRRHVPSIDGLETRRLMSAGGTSVVSAAFHGIPASLIPAIKGTIVGAVTNITPISATSELITYTARGKANIIGDGKGSGQHVITSKLLKDNSSKDTYKNGSATVKGTTDTVAIHYSGSGHTNTDGSWTATWKGTAKAVAGQHAGLSGSFTAQLGGTSRSGAFTINLTIRV